MFRKFPILPHLLTGLLIVVGSAAWQGTSIPIHYDLFPRYRYFCALPLMSGELFYGNRCELLTCGGELPKLVQFEL